MITTANPEMAEYFSPAEVATYSSAEELTETAIYLASHEEERRELATLGYARTIRDHTAEVRLAELFRIIAERGWLNH